VTVAMHEAFLYNSEKSDVFFCGACQSKVAEYFSNSSNSDMYNKHCWLSSKRITTDLVEV
jgi:cytidine deaminase